MKKFEEFEYIIRKAMRVDIPQLVDLGARFYQESNFLGNLTMSRNNYQRCLERYIDYPFVAALVAVKGGEILGYLHIYAQNDYTEEYIGEAFQFYVRPEYRGSGVSRALVEAAVVQYAEWDCKRAYVEAAPGIKSLVTLQQFENLWGRYGYTKIGIVMMKDFKVD